MASQKIPNSSRLTSLKNFLFTEQGLIVVCLTVLASIYYFAWGGLTLSKSSVSLGFIALGAKYIWDDKENLAQAKKYREERFIGYALAAFGLTLFFVFRSSASFQYLLFVLVLSGFALTLWGAAFFVDHVLACCLIAVGLYPNIIFVVNVLWKLVTPPFVLENFTGTLAGRALNFIGQPATVEARFISTGNGSVEVASGCSGLEMAVSMACIGFLMGLFFKQPWPKILVAMVVGIVMALIINIPRVMILAYVVGYHGDRAFDFWHGHWGGQIFMAILFTPYYYLVTAFFENKIFRSAILKT